MNNLPAISIYLDTRRQKQSGKYPVKLRVFTQKPRIQKLYPTDFEFSKDEFQSIWETTKPRKEFKESRLKLQQIEAEAIETAKNINPFCFVKFKINLYNIKSKSEDVFSIFDSIASEKKKKGAISTAEKYELAKKSIVRYLNKRNLKLDELPFESITIDFLNDYEYFAKEESLSPATIGIYLRNLRAVYKIAIDKELISGNSYPFGKKKYEIPTASKVNKALTEAELKLMWQYKPETPEQIKAKDFWFFSYFSYGMNVKDICELKHKSIDGNFFTYVRAKTKNTKRKETKKQVAISKNVSEIIEKYKDNKSDYLFGIINDSMTAEQKHNKIKDFNYFINKHIRKIALEVGVNESLAKSLGTYHARHSFATVQIRKGKSFELISEILHDGNLATTQNYINSFPKESYSDLSNEMEL